MQVIDQTATSHYVQANGVRIHYHDVGSGEPVIMLHGAGPGADSWGNFVHNTPAISQRFRCLLVDMPQYGKSEKVVIEGGRQSFTANVLSDFIDQLGLGKAHFIGNSMGGQAAIKLAIDAPDKVDRLVVLGATPVGYSLFAPSPLEGIKLIAGYYKGDGPSMAKMRQLLQTLVYDSSFLTEEMVRQRYEATLDPDVIRIFSTTPPVKEDLSDQLHRVACPTLLVWGNEDRFGALDVGLLMLRKFQNARMHIFNRCGHWAQVEHAEEFNRLVLDFLS
jgi:4,5:9,10-diseco-3-hydroxy-5,9,17-trioxoandrosta-1(10),2-diene-4-oate hydrolase